MTNYWKFVKFINIFHCQNFAPYSKLIIHLEKRIVKAEIQIKDLQKRIDRIRHRVTYRKEKYSNLNMLNEELQIKLELDNEKVQGVLHEEILQLEQKKLDL